MSVEEHCRIVGAVARELMSRLPECVTELLPKGTPVVAALHDIGKVSPGFQKKYFNDRLASLMPALACIPNSKFESDHTLIGAAALNHYEMTCFDSSPTAEIVGAHHGAGHSNTPRHDKGSKFGGMAWADERRKLIDLLVRDFGPLSRGEMSPTSRDILAGLVSVADWIGSDEDYFPSKGLPAGEDILTRARRAVDQCGWVVPSIRRGLRFEDLFDDCSPYQMQRQFIDLVTEPGLHILEAPMGSGKTEAALYAAYRLMASRANQGLYFGLPTRLTSDKIHERVIPFLERICTDGMWPKLAHGTAWLTAYEHGGKEFSSGGKWFNPRKRRLLYPFAVGTVDQSLMSVLRVKHFFVRAFGLAGKVVILDEVHSYDIYTGTLLEELVRRLLEMRCTVIILSATLTAERRRRLLSLEIAENKEEPYPLITSETNGRVTSASAPAPGRQDYQVRLDDLDSDGVAECAVRKALAGHCVLCIANTVAVAQEWYDAILSKMTLGSVPVGLLHAKFPLFRRSDLESYWIGVLGKDGNRPEGCVLVATQVVEQSVDIDADFMITELAPTDMLLQRMGRVWRHSRKKQRPCAIPEVVIVSGDPMDLTTEEGIVNAFGKPNCCVYAPYVLWRSWQQWKYLRLARFPEDIRGLLESTYAEPTEREADGVEALRRRLEEFRAKLAEYAESAKASVTSLGSMEDREGVATRYSTLPMTDVLLVKDIDSKGRKASVRLLSGPESLIIDADRKDFPVTAQLHKNLVSIPTYRIKRLGNPKTPIWLERHFFNPTPVLIWDEMNGELRMEDGKPTPFMYDNQRGLRLKKRDADSSHVVSQSYSDYDGLDVFDKSRLDW